MATRSSSRDSGSASTLLTPTVGELLVRLRQGRLRLPPFRQPGAFSQEDVADVLDSIVGGFPIGALVVWCHAAPMGRVDLHVAQMDAPEVDDAWWVITGDRQVVALATQLDAQLDEVVLSYRVPVWVLEHDDPSAIAQVTQRLPGPRMAREAVDAIRELDAPVSMSLYDQSERLSALGVGHINPIRTFTLLRGVLDDGRAFADEPETWRSSEREAVGRVAEPAIRRALSFLRFDAGVPHLKLVPDEGLLIVLVRFFHVHRRRSLEPRHRLLLRRWLWRSMLGSPSETPRSLHARLGTEEAVETHLSRLLDHAPRRASLLGRATDTRTQRIALLALSQLRPQSLLDGRHVDVVSVLEAAQTARVDDGDPSAFGQLIHSPAPALAERILQAEPAVQRSHGISPDALEHLRRDDLDAFVAQRGADIESLIRDDLGPRMAEWRASDRPSIASLLEMPDEDDDDGT